MATFTDPMNPPGRLTPPGDYGTQVKKDIDDALGVMHYALSLIDKFTGWNIEAEVVDWLGLNYGQLLSIRDAWNSAGWALDDINTNLTSGVSTLFDQSSGTMSNPHWSGNAASAFYDYMIGWLAALSEDRDACFTIRDQLTSLAGQAKDALTIVIQAIRTVISLLGAAGASIEIPVWGEVEIGKAIWQTISLINNVRKVIGALMNSVKMAIDTVHAITDLANSASPTIQVNIPVTAYGGPTNPGV
jgi:hypothetical protein